MRCKSLFAYGHVAASAVAGRLRRRLASERGQGTVEYVGLILLVSMLMVGMVAAMKGFNGDLGHRDRRGDHRQDQGRR